MFGPRAYKNIKDILSLGGPAVLVQKQQEHFPQMEHVSLGQFLLRRLKELNCDDIFGGNRVFAIVFAIVFNHAFTSFTICRIVVA